MSDYQKHNNVTPKVSKACLTYFVPAAGSSHVRGRERLLDEHLEDLVVGRSIDRSVDPSVRRSVRPSVRR